MLVAEEMCILLYGSDFMFELGMGGLLNAHMCMYDVAACEDLNASLWPGTLVRTCIVLYSV